MSETDIQMQVVELEADEAEQTLLNFFDRESGKWLLPKEGRFWDAVKAAHAVGHTGKGKLIAIIDGGFDLSIPRLSERTRSIPIQNQSSLKPTAHGTLVALLVLEAAPEAELELYEVSALDGKIDTELLIEAFDRVRTSSASVLNVSMGCPKPLSKEELIDLEVGIGLTNAEFRKSLEDMQPCTDHKCKLCAAADAVSKTGKLVVAAAGNDANAIYCPARSSNVIASGFLVEEYSIAPDGGELSNAHLSCEFSHSQFTDYTIKQVPGALGTSYSAPLLAGFLALDTDWDEFSAFVVAQRKASVAASAYFYYRNAQESDNSLLDWAIDEFEKALELQPHRHEKDDSLIPCAECILFAEDTYVNYGLALASKGELVRAANLWETVAKLAPDSPHAYANLGWLNYKNARELLSEDLPTIACRALEYFSKAADLYSRAIAIRPLFDGYMNEYLEISETEHRIRIAVVHRLKLLRLLKLYFDSQKSLQQVAMAMDILLTLSPRAVFTEERKQVCMFLEELMQPSNDIGREIGKKFSIAEFLNVWKAELPRLS